MNPDVPTRDKPAQVRRAYRLRRALTIAALLFLGGVVSVLGTIVVTQMHIADLATDTRDNVLPLIVNQQEVSRDVERLILFGEELLNSSDPAKRRQARLSAQTLVFNESGFRHDSKTHEVGDRTLDVLTDLAHQRDRRDALNEKALGLLLDLGASPALFLVRDTQGESLKALLGRAMSTDTRETLDELSAHIDQTLRGNNVHADLAGKVQRLLDLRREIVALDASSTSTWDEMKHQLKSVTDTLVTQAELQTSDRFSSIQAQASHVEWVSAAGLGGFIVLLGLLVLGAHRYFFGPLMKATETLDQALHGKHAADLPGSAIVEINSIITAAGTLVANTHALAEERQKVLAARLEAAAAAARNLEIQVQQRTQDLKLAMLRAETANQTKSAFLANMSHEIRTPLNAILGMALLMRRGGVNPRQADQLDKIDQASQHLLGIINDILDLAKIEAGKLALEEMDVVIGSLSNNVISMLAERAAKKGLDLHAEIDPLPAQQLCGDPTRLTQALLNYATNAIKFTEKGAVILRVRTVSETANDILLRFEVEDTGIGVPPESADRIFDAFEQADSSTTRKYGGTGLGLTITKHLAEIMGGSVGMHSIPGRGSTFWFTARLRKGNNGKGRGEPPQAAITDAERIIAEKYRGARILLVEDEPINQELASMLLTEVGLVVETAGDGQVGLEMAERQDYALVLMDMHMPRMSGIEATQKIRKLPGKENLPILAMTANAFPEDKLRCIDAGMNDFIAKPVDSTLLFTVLLKWLDKGQHQNKPASV